MADPKQEDDICREIGTLAAPLWVIAFCVAFWTLAVAVAVLLRGC